MIAEKKNVVKKEKVKTVDKRETDGFVVRAAALASLKRKAVELEEGSSLDDSTDSVTPVKEARNSSLAKEAANAICNFSSMMEFASRSKQDEIAVQKEANALMSKRLELDEQRFLRESVERDARFQLEKEERATQLAFMKGTLNMIRALTEKL